MSKSQSKAVTRKRWSPPPVPRPEPRGAIVVGTDPCTCGHAPEEHGRDRDYPGSTACNITACYCIAYEAA